MTQRDGMGREQGGGIGMRNTCKSMADSFQCMRKPTTIKKKKKKEKKEYKNKIDKWDPIQLRSSFTAN